MQLSTHLPGYCLVDAFFSLFTILDTYHLQGYYVDWYNLVRNDFCKRTVFLYKPSTALIR